MRTLYLLRGAPGSGKSTWIKDNKLSPYTLCADDIRTMIQSPVMDISGNYKISQKNDRQVWELLFQLLETRMSRGEFVIIDATHYKRELLNRYVKLISKYRYRAYVVDFTDVSLEECLKRNKERDPYKYVPEETIEKMYAVFTAEQNIQLKSCFTQLSRDEAVELIDKVDIRDFNKWENIVVFGDIHGCYSPLEEYFKQYPYNEKWMYIFVGDYIDRGLENDKVLNFLIEFSKKDNVLCLEGNHERWLRYYSSKDEDDWSFIKSKEFTDHTIPQIQNIDKKEIREFCRRLGQYALFEYNDHNFLITHGGLPDIPTIKISTEEMIKGVGKYEDSKELYSAFNKNRSIYDIQIHGHRNVYLDPVLNGFINYNLCSAVEYGDDLRILHLNGSYDINDVDQIFIPVTIHADRPVSTKIIFNKTNNELVESLNKDKHIIKKKLDDGIISYSFDRDVFFSKDWNNINCRARGLFLRGDKIIARSYDKFFNYMELRETQPISLRSTLQYPVDVYDKENGFLGLVSLDRETDKLFIASKSTNKGEFADIVREQFSKLECANDISNWFTDNDKTLIFEVIDPIKDPHIIEYDKPQMILLDIVDNSFETNYMPYNELVKFAQKYKLNHKFKCKTLNNFEEVMQYIKNIEADKTDEYEGVVFRDVNNFQFKLKTPFYNKWKYFRLIKDKYCRGTLKQVFKDKEEVEFVNYLKSKDNEQLKLKSIIDIRNEIKKEKYS